MTFKITNIGQLVTYNSNKHYIEKLKDVEIVIEEERIAQIGRELPSSHDEIDAGGHLVTPGFVDPHTHPVFAETRESEFAMRVAGMSYKDISNSGGGIKSSVRALREIDEEELAIMVECRIREFLRFGTTTLEAKSGYGLSTESEMKSLRVLERACKEVPIDIVPTFLGAHDFPEEYAENKSEYIDLVCYEMIPAVVKQGIAEFCDVFCEKGWFDVEDSRRILQVAKDYGLKLRLHADEFEDSGAASLAAELKAFSADHLIKISDDGIRDIVNNGVVAILLPGTTFFLGETLYAPADRLLAAGAEVALASDFNPGSSMIQSMAFIISLACLYMGMTVEDAMQAATYSAAKSLNRENVIGSIEPGKQADLIIWRLKNLSEIPYHITGNCVEKVIKKGILVVDRCGDLS